MPVGTKELTNMLDYTPDALAGGNSAPYGHEWAVNGQGEGKLGDNSLLPKSMAFSRETAIDVACASSIVGQLPQKSFQPERISGYCASH